jgi:hypothetical protein
MVEIHHSLPDRIRSLQAIIMSDERFNVGDMVKIWAPGYGYSPTPRWIEGVVSRPSTKHRVWVKFRTATGREIERMKAPHNVVKRNKGH